MFKRSKLGSSALARAQAQLSGQRILENFNVYGDELQDYLTACKQNSALMGSPFNNEIGYLSNLSIEDTMENEWKRKQYVKTAAAVKPEGIREQLLTSNGFLKKAEKSTAAQSLKVSNCALKKADEADSRSLNAVSARVRSSNAVLARLAQVENEIMNRKLNKHQINADENVQVSDDEQLSPKSSTELSGRGSRFLKRVVDTAAKHECNAEVQNKVESSIKDLHQAHLNTPVKVGTIDSDEEEMKKMLEGSLELSESEHIKRLQRTPPHGSELHKQSVVRKYPRSHLRLPSPPSAGSPQLSLSPRMKFVKRIPVSSTEQSEIKSLDELFTEPSATEDVRSLDSETSDEFKLNILTLEDLIPAVEQKSTKISPTLKDEEGQHLGVPSTQSTCHNLRSNVTSELVRSCLQSTKLSREKDANHLENEIWAKSDATGSEISEYLNGDSNVSRKERKSSEKLAEQLEEDDLNTKCSEYSEDFETSNCEVSSVKMDQGESHFEQSCEEESRTDYSDNTSYSTSSSPVPDHSKLATCTESPCSDRKVWKSLSKVTVKDTAIQTQLSSFHYTWHKDDGVAVLGTSLGAASVDPTPIASHIISPEAMEALTSYSPASLALNDMLKQQLTLTRQFVQVSRLLYLSIVASIEEDQYHYTTLEETKEFVSNQRSPSLTLEQALKEVQDEMEQYHNM
ncbi:uncharacterized protein C19orf44 homolog isoform X1 [Mobula birostris]|uniref:uncharacterized protein C19orf44 homolog isoform X1 n=2 Tax=Mobula birostris TaxID=1983395 RepID=UPI003B28262E